MEITVTKSNGEYYSNTKTPKMKKKEFKTTKEKMQYILVFLSEIATSKTSKDNPSHLKGAKFLFLKENGRGFDQIDYTIPGTEKEIEQLLKLQYD